MNKPLADRIRPTELKDVVGQKHLLSPDKALYNMIQNGDIPNLIFYGPSGVGKTTVASIIANKTKRALRKLNGTSASTQDIKDIVSEIGTFSAPNGILLYLDEIQYFNKRQQQSLLEYIENGKITLIASTTENPYFYVYSAILSRSTVFEFKALNYTDIIPAVERGFKFLEEENNLKITYSDDVVKKIAQGCGGDVRKALNGVENCYFATPTIDGVKAVSIETAEELTQKSAMRYDKDGDEHYDIVSAYQKSMRGSDTNAALHYLARLLEAGDLPSACRRLMVCACEDVGLAYPQIIPIVKAAVDAAMMVGLPEAINTAMADVKKGNFGPIPRQLQNKHYDGEDTEIKGQHYVYPHDCPNHWTQQQYLPDKLKNTKYYEYGTNKNEQAHKEYWSRIKGEK